MEGCASPSEILRLVRPLTEQTLTLESASATARIVAVIAREPLRWIATLRLVDRAGRSRGMRRVAQSSADCRGLDEAVAVVIATLADGVDHGRAERGMRRPGGRELIGLAAFLAGAVALGPGPWLGPGIAVELPIGLPLALDATVYLPRDRLNAAGRGARFWGFHGGATLCQPLFGSSLSLNGCLSTQLGAIWATGAALTDARSALSPVWLLALGPKLRLAASPAASFELSISAGWVPIAPHFHWEIQGDTEAFAPGPFAIFARLGFISWLL